VAAGVQHDHRAGRQGVQLGDHRLGVGAAGGRVVVGVGVDREAGGFEQGAVVFPARVGDVNGGARDDALDQVAADAQGAGAAEGLGGDDAAVTDDGAVGAEEQVLHGAVVGDRAFDGLVATRRGGFEAGLFGAATAPSRGSCRCRRSNANAEVDLGAAAIRVEGFIQAKNRIAGAISTAAKIEELMDSP
jgi:hypothetical protein